MGIFLLSDILVSQYSINFDIAQEKWLPQNAKNRKPFFLRRILKSDIVDASLSR
jgi:hypothetical protein